MHCAHSERKLCLFKNAQMEEKSGREMVKIKASPHKRVHFCQASETRVTTVTIILLNETKEKHSFPHLHKGLSVSRRAAAFRAHAIRQL